MTAPPVNNKVVGTGGQGNLYDVEKGILAVIISVTLDDRPEDGL
jgi:hypothetical protein